MPVLLRRDRLLVCSKARGSDQSNNSVYRLRVGASAQQRGIYVGVCGDDYVVLGKAVFFLWEDTNHLFDDECCC